MGLNGWACVSKFKLGLNFDLRIFPELGIVFGFRFRLFSFVELVGLEFGWPFGSAWLLLLDAECC